MGYDESDLLPISGLQHLAYCERQCALIHVERVWVENQYTAKGNAFHTRAHEGSREVRNQRVTTFGQRVRSLTLGVWGMTDAVQLDYTDRGFSQLEAVLPIEYKVGRPKRGDYDLIQLAAQAVCLEEMLRISISEAALFYGATRRRLSVRIDEELREKLYRYASRYQEIVDRGETPPPRYRKQLCDRCSLFEICKPKAVSQRSAYAYVQQQLAVGLKE
jgi:CRISPR-associated exonuclease Cas4